MFANGERVPDQRVLSGVNASGSDFEERRHCPRSDGAQQSAYSFLGLDPEEVVSAVAEPVHVAEGAVVRHVSRDERDLVHRVVVQGRLKRHRKQRFSSALSTRKKYPSRRNKHALRRAEHILFRATRKLPKDDKSV